MCRTDFAINPRKTRPHPSRAVALAGEVHTLHRWIQPARHGQFRSDISIEIGADLRYQAMAVHRPVPMLLPPEQHLGERLVDCVPKDLVFQFVTAAERSICLHEPIDMRYPLILKGRLVLSHTRVRADEARKVFLAEIMRFTAALALFTAV